MKTILITGSSSGIGRASVFKFQREGWNVVATMRSPQNETELNQLDNVLVTSLDVLNLESINGAIQAGIERFGKIDALVNNAGFGVLGPFEMLSEEQIQRSFDVNLFGVMRVIKAILPHFRENKSGTLINISSMGGRVSFPTYSAYHTTKFALEGFTECLAYELIPFGIHTKIVEPGSTISKFSDAAEVVDSGVYNELVEKSLANWAKYDTPTATSEDVADVIFQAASDDDDRLRYTAGKDSEKYLDIRNHGTDQEYVDYMRNRYIPDFVSKK